MHPATRRARIFAAYCIEREFFSPHRGRRPIVNLCEDRPRIHGEKSPYFLSTSLMYAEKTRAFMSALPAASKTLFGCQSTESTVERIGFLSCFATHQLLSASNEQTAIALLDIGNSLTHTHIFQRRRVKPTTHLAPLATANLSSNGLQRTYVAARLMRSKTSVGFQTMRPVSGSGACCHT
jgi:hypothetical protein